MKPVALRPAKGSTNKGKRLIRKKKSVVQLTEQQFINNVNCEFVIGIDPDLDASGFAVVSRRENRIIDLQTLDVFDVMQAVKPFTKDSLVIYVELPESRNVWHGEADFMKTANIVKRLSNASSKGIDVGINRGVGLTLIKILTRAGYTVVPVNPLGLVNGKKCGHDDFVARTGWTGGQTNPEKRDSGLIAWHFR